MLRRGALVASTVLYPDPLLANALAASGFPLEIVQADRWLSELKNLKGEQFEAMRWGAGALISSRRRCR